MLACLNRVPRDWSTINTVRASFVSQALAVASLSIIILPKTGFIEWVFGSDWRYYVSLIGALIFIAGYVLPFFLSTPEYRQPRRRTEHLDYWKSVASWGFFDDRRDQLDKVIKRMAEAPPPDLPEGTELNAQVNLADAMKLTEKEDWRLVHGALYDAELQLRAFDQHFLRCWIALLLYAGIVIILSANLLNFSCYLVPICGK